MAAEHRAINWNSGPWFDKLTTNGYLASPFALNIAMSGNRTESR